MKLSLSPHASVVVALLTFSLTMECSDQSDTWLACIASLHVILAASCMRQWWSYLPSGPALGYLCICGCVGCR